MPKHVAKSDFSPAEARRIAIAAQGLTDLRPRGEAGRRHVRKLFDRLGVVQIDSVNVLARTHYLPAFSRLGGYDRQHLEAEAWGRKPSLFEYWGHECSLMPLELQPLLRWRMARAESGEGLWTGLARFSRERRDYIDNILAEIERRGSVTGGDFAEGPRGQPGWWSWSDGKRALEWLFWAGFITTKTRRGFERVYDLTERVLPARITALPTPSEPDAHRELLRIAARAMGSPPKPTFGTISACQWPRPARGSRNWSRRASWPRSPSSVGANRPICILTRRSRAASPPPPCSRRSTT